ncbi:succinate--CoA ligase subunit alpha [Candidatus Borrarchaeum sp.]|uniref:succinate--CoA ligase subunit alpha n=1 Tax=Candidatus Borrarchaeum sp. TaxID=2846742 RepID=UPI00257EDD51|nr:succinate--CoA ligase subunit alpha [Candidatus Borrarchaeum sp.]
MTILVDKKTKILVQGITGREGQFHTKVMLDYGTQIVAGVTPGKGGQELHGIPVYDYVSEAVEETQATASILFIPARFVADAVYEAIESNLNPIVIITEGIPIRDSIGFVNYARDKNIVIIGPNCPGIISPEECKVGVMPSHVFRKGPVGIIARSGTLFYEIAATLTDADSRLGQSTCVGIGGDPIIGSDFIEIVQRFQADPETKAMVIIGEIGGDAEERLADYVQDHKVKPTVAFIAGKTAPPGKRMGHAGAIISMGVGSAEGKIYRLKETGIQVADVPSDVAKILKDVLSF